MNCVRQEPETGQRRGEDENDTIDSGSDGSPKPTALAMRDFAAFLETLPVKRLPPRRIDAVVVA